MLPKKRSFTYKNLKHSINYPMEKDQFLDALKLANVNNHSRKKMSLTISQIIVFLALIPENNWKNDARLIGRVLRKYSLVSNARSGNQIPTNIFCLDLYSHGKFNWVNKYIFNNLIGSIRFNFPTYVFSKSEATF